MSPSATFPSESTAAPTASFPEVHIPSDKKAGLRTISLYQLQSGSASERNLLLETCMNDGFFYLDLSHPNFASLLAFVDATFNCSKELFNYPPEIKSLFDVDKISDLKVNGYKPKGRNVVGNGKDGKNDGFESWVLPRNGVLQLSNEPFPHPPVVANHLPDISGLFDGLSSAAHVILSSLSDSLSLPAGQRLEDFQGLNRPSPDILRVLKYHANSNTDIIPQTPHTDLGSLTFVFSTTPGLQVLPPGVQQKPGAYSESDWLYVEPRPGHAIVNIGDCITLMTNGILRSALHRVGPVTGCAMPERYSMAYLMRPEDQTVLRALDSPLIPKSTIGEDVVTSGAWIRKKFKALRGQKDAGNFDQILTGGRGILV
ncbi:oxidoreductase, 2OG-Fe(II) oxygenase family, putative [Talaromyces stipitatus ATCC 10500]|uniref:Oxidoreductase, 2OG-Fe(II) oxygenase family, putative n=1 Tax=Talaromyces stipitatus (strain ATCC 10500 / CBS 375.48 / QM 6759 / NRRL 1006) TaxID=441959 RepID=B8ML73_TALSN|nr:oxidoreductase, 2OG-Fe(II) oxygenase family, putative [Talaromyces stipitatus ATCC 10500]EED14988.1 oxidoreductase, 2OG-Fe(II) oxygenase family, putative [Talaromyces stipitatus ATCC 10500]